ncbi:MAG: TonB-dependent receptor [Bacteroidia bacterium]|nr:TonB-dependent receptor [Bacteroidia bacterium]
MRYFLLIISVFVFLSFKTQTLTQNIKGTIVDKQSQATLPGAVVQLMDSTKKYAVADENGFFRIEKVPIGRQNIKITYTGYKQKQVTVILNSGKETVINIELEENVIQGQEIEIIVEQDKTKTNNKMSTVSSRVFSSEEAGRYAGSRNDPARMAANFAGVSGANDSRNDIIVRGNSPLGVLWRLNGLDIPNPNHFGNSGSTGGPISILNNNSLDNSDFMTGAFAADYANATAGVFDLKMRDGNNEKHEFMSQIGFNGFELGAEGPFNKKKNATYLVNYRYSTLSVFKALNIDFGTGAAVPQYQDLTFKTDFKTKVGKFSFWGIGGLSYIALLDKDKVKGKDLYGYSARDTYFRSNIGSSGVTHVILFKNNAYLKTNIGISGQYNNIIADRIDTNFATPGNKKPEYRSTSQNIIYSFNTIYNKKMNSKNFVNGGVFFDLYNSLLVDSTDITFGYNTFKVLRDYKGVSSMARAFFQWQHKFTDKLMLNTGASSQYFLLNSKYSVEPRLGLKYSISDKQSLSLGGGMHSQLQPLYVYFASETDSNGVRTETNKDLDFTRAVHGVIAHDVSFNNSFRLKTELYYQYIYNAPVDKMPSTFSALNLGADFNSPNVVNLVSKGEGYNYGVELTLEKFYSKGYYFLFTTSIFESKYKASDGILRNTAFNGNYVVNLLGGKEFKLNQRATLTLDVRGTYAGGKRYVPVDLAASIAYGDEVRDYTQAYLKRYPDYFRMDVKPGFKLNTKRLTHEWSVDIQNISKHKNIFQQSYDLTDKSLKTDYQLIFFVIPQYRILF